jgi:hypothetical protein
MRLTAEEKAAGIAAAEKDIVEKAIHAYQVWSVHRDFTGYAEAQRRLLAAAGALLTIREAKEKHS